MTCHLARSLEQRTSQQVIVNYWHSSVCMWQLVALLERVLCAPKFSARENVSEKALKLRRGAIRSLCMRVHTNSGPADSSINCCNVRAVPRRKTARKFTTCTKPVTVPHLGRQRRGSVDGEIAKPSSCCDKSSQRVAIADHNARQAAPQRVALESGCPSWLPLRQVSDPSTLH